MSKRSEATPVGLLPALQTHQWFASCPSEFQQALVNLSRLVHLSPGESLFARGDNAEALCCVVAGALLLGSVSPGDGRHRLMLYAEPYHWFGEIALLDELPRSQDAVADTASTVLVVPRPRLEAWLAQHPRYWRDLARLACGKLRLVLSAMEDQVTLTVEEQLARRLLLAATNFAQLAPEQARRRVRMPQDYLARMLGVSRQTVNKALRALERERVLVLHYAEIEIVDVEALMARCGGIDATQLPQERLRRMTVPDLRPAPPVGDAFDVNQTAFKDA